MERGLSRRRRELRPRVHQKTAHSGPEGLLFGIAVKDRRGSRQSLYLRSLFPPVPTCVFPLQRSVKVTIWKAPASSGSASNRYGFGKPKVLDENFSPSSFFALIGQRLRRTASSGIF